MNLKKQHNHEIWLMSIGIAALLLPFVTFASAKQTSSVKPRVAELLARLQSPTWPERADAYGQLISDPTAVQNPEIKSALIGLLDRENQAQPSKEPNFDPARGEEYAEYAGLLGDTVVSLIDWKNPDQVCVVANSPLNSSSPLVAMLAKTGEPILPCLMAMHKSSKSFDRLNAAAVLVELRASARGLGAETTMKIQNAVTDSLHDPEEIVRVGTIDTLAKFGSADMIPALQQVAETDPAPEVQGQSIRKFAERAVAEIQTRVNRK